jgi:hypothetical protein
VAIVHYPPCLWGEGASLNDVAITECHYRICEQKNCFHIGFQRSLTTHACSADALLRSTAPYQQPHGPSCALAVEGTNMCTYQSNNSHHTTPHHTRSPPTCVTTRLSSPLKPPLLYYPHQSKMPLVYAFKAPARPPSSLPPLLPPPGQQPLLIHTPIQTSCLA